MIEHFGLSFSSFLQILSIHLLILLSLLICWKVFGFWHSIWCVVILDHRFYKLSVVRNKRIFVQGLWSWWQWLEIHHFPDQSSVLIGNICVVSILLVVTNIIKDWFKGESISHLIEEERQEIVSNWSELNKISSRIWIDAKSKWSTIF